MRAGTPNTVQACSGGGHPQPVCCSARARWRCGCAAGRGVWCRRCAPRAALFGTHAQCERPVGHPCVVKGALVPRSTVRGVAGHTHAYQDGFNKTKKDGGCDGPPALAWRRGTPFFSVPFCATSCDIPTPAAQGGLLGVARTPSRARGGRCPTSCLPVTRSCSVRPLFCSFDFFV